MKPRTIRRRIVISTGADETARLEVVVTVDRAHVNATPAESETSARPRRQSGTQARRGGTTKRANTP